MSSLMLVRSMVHKGNYHCNCAGPGRVYYCTMGHGPDFQSLDEEFFIYS